MPTITPGGSSEHDEKKPKAAEPDKPAGPQPGGKPNPPPIEYLGVQHEAPGTKPTGALPIDAPRDPQTNQPPAAHPNPMAGKDQITASTVGRALGEFERGTQHPESKAAREAREKREHDEEKAETHKAGGR